MLHEVEIPNEARQQGTQGQEHDGAIRAKAVAHGHRPREERGPQPHQYARDNTDDHALARDALLGASKAAVSLPVKDHSNERTNHAKPDKSRAALGLQRIAENSSYHQSDSD